MRKSRKIPARTTVQSGRYLDYASGVVANPGAIHTLGVLEKSKLESARATVAHILGAQPDEVIFTSGATESNNLAILGATSAQIFSHCALPLWGGTLADKKFKQTLPIPHIVTTNIEHASVLEVCKHLAKTKQAEVTYVPVGENGIVDSGEIKKAFRPNTVLVSVMYANNEIGTIEPLREIGKIIRHYNKINSKKIIFHTDATQAINYLPINVLKLGVDLLSFNSAKIYGPKGVGILYIKRHTPISKIMFGGDQEFGLRPGTENVTGAVGLAGALKITEKIKNKENKRLIKLRDYFIDKLLYSTMGAEYRIVLNGDLKNRLPNNVNISIPKIPSDLLVIELSAHGIMASAKSACKSGDGKASHVINAINKNIKETDGSLRFSLGRYTNKADLIYTVKTLSKILTKLKIWYD